MFAQALSIEHGRLPCYYSMLGLSCSYVEKLIKELPSMLADLSNGDLNSAEKDHLSNGISFQHTENGTNPREAQSMLLERIASEMNRLKFYITHAQFVEQVSGKDHMLNHLSIPAACLTHPEIKYGWTHRVRILCEVQQEEPLEVDFLPFVEVDFICFSQQQEGEMVFLIQFSIIKSQLPSFFNNFDPRAAAANFPSGAQAYLAGLTFALAVSPCSTPVLATLLGYVAASKPAFIPQILSMDQPNEAVYKPCGGETVTNLGQIGLKRQTMTHNGLRSLNKLDMLQMKKNAKAIAKHASNKNGPKTENDRPSSAIMYGSGMNIVFVGAEVGPWSKTGGLGDVLGGLPPAMAFWQWALCYDSFPTLRPVQRCMGYSLTKFADKKDVVGLQEQVFVRKVIKLHDKYMAYVNNCFMNHTLFHKALKEAFEVFCNKGVGGSSSAELLATFCDKILNKEPNNKTISPPNPH
ncbi:unnamed protein product [Camellia sinensis]